MINPMQTLQTYEVWDDDTFQPIELSFYSSRSRLFRLAPMGLGTAYVESLSGYISRLAHAHSLPPTQLIAVEFLPHLSQPTTNSSTKTEATITPFQIQAREINGLSSVTQAWVKVVNSLTQQSNLHLLTLLPYAPLLSDRNLMRSERAWCAVCYHEWQQSGQTLYEPLLWQLKLLKICSRHHQPLQKLCPNPKCDKPQPLLASFSHPGYCSHCLGWLGEKLVEIPKGGSIDNPPTEPAPTLDKDSSKVSENEANKQGLDQEWVSREMTALVAALPSLTYITASNSTSFKSTIEKWVSQQLAAGATLNELARATGISVAILKTWQSDQTLPSLLNLLRFCQVLKQDLLPLLLHGELSAQSLLLAPATNSTLAARDKPKISKTVAKSVKRLPFVKLHRKLQQLAQDKSTSAPSLSEVAAEVGYEEKHLHKDFPQLAHTIEANYKARRYDFSREQCLLEEVMSGTEYPPPSMLAVAQRLGRNQSILKRHFPEQYAAIVDRHQHYRQTYYQQKEEQKAAQIRQSVQQLVGQGVYPSVKRVGQLLGDNHFMFKAAYAKAWRESLQASSGL